MGNFAFSHTVCLFGQHVVPFVRPNGEAGSYCIALTYCHCKVNGETRIAATVLAV